ncbi:cyclopropane-fatty-acyl-phospholipid synthase family protein [Thiothrix lacustris]|uniref:cyclopropane-fatty-acyl-phospholipid synthase family protein n=1 Tax=Thiothrix lacustris TaxID=525917 RepID=UPI0027E5051E|nr:cyclopropane-fatty-acyl-phospholipid synthase family protein [Thiothrix lacustris]WMP17579.1 cyclopropane-fatty-acyl-phospholipid synthase family protein [Thiothrix lacustris]
MNLENTLTTPLAPNFEHLPTFKRWLMSVLARIRHGKLTIYLDGECYVVGDTDEYHATIHIHHPMRLAWKCLTKGDLGFGQAYLSGDWSSDHPADLLTLLVQNWHKIGTTLDARGQWLRLPTKWLHQLRRNSVKNSRKNIAHHYDMGNDFYREWLDGGMTYSSALYTSPEMSLEQAQHAKYQRILDELQAQPEQSILEIGCGWGGFAEVAAEAGCKVHGITLSSEQLAWAQQRLARFGEQTHLELRDYRHLEGTYDHIVSIEMFEAVGEEYWQTYFGTLQRSLKPGGRAVLQIITIGDEWFETYRARPDFIQRYVFPGGMLPCPAKLDALVAESNLKQINHIGFGADYAHTLAEWDKRFSAALPALRPLGYDQRFERLWRYYLAYCEAGFNEGRIDVIQLTLEKPHA